MIDGTGVELAIEWFVNGVYDRLEDRFGRVTAFFGSLFLAVALLGSIGAAAWYFLFS